MFDRLIVTVLSQVYRYHCKMYHRCTDKFYSCVWIDDKYGCKHYADKAKKHNEICGRIDTLIYSLTGEDI